jgi:uncharacterized protein YcaQ
MGKHPIHLTKPEARRFILAHQGLWPPRHQWGKDGIIKYIRRVGCIQFDPLNIVGTNPDLVLQSRIGDYRPSMLRELLYEERQLLDGWDKMMSIYSVEDWPYFARERQSALNELGNPERPIVPYLPEIRRIISEKAPVSSDDLNFNQKVDWPWAPTRLSRAALESMYFWGELIIHHRVNTRKFYDFTVKYLPDSILSAHDPHEEAVEYHDWRILRRIGGIGLIWNRSGDAWLGLPGLKREQREASLARLLKRGEVLEAVVEGIDQPLFLRATDQAVLETVCSHQEGVPKASVIAPLDNLLWDRRFIKELFEFDYRWEVYKPIAERQYGYYVLPVLYGDRFIARFEPGYDKKRAVMVIKNWWWEPPIRLDESALVECFSGFKQYMGVKKVALAKGISKRKDLMWLKEI